MCCCNLKQENMLQSQGEMLVMCHIPKYIFFIWHDSPPVGQGLLIHEVSRPHSHTPHLVGLLWTSDQPITEISTWQHTQQTDIHAPPWWDSNPQSQQASGRRRSP